MGTDEVSAIVVLDDDDTFTALAGSTVRLILSTDLEAAAQGGPSTVPAQDTFDLSSPADLRRLADLLEAQGG